MRPEKHSLTICKHRTSVTLEPEFWHQFRLLAMRKKKSLNQLATEIDNMRKAEMTLASAIRVYILKDLQMHNSVADL